MTKPVQKRHRKNLLVENLILKFFNFEEPGPLEKMCQLHGLERTRTREGGASCC